MDKGGKNKFPNDKFYDPKGSSRFFSIIAVFQKYAQQTFPSNTLIGNPSVMLSSGIRQFF